MRKIRVLFNDSRINKVNKDAIAYPSITGTIYIRQGDITEIDPAFAEEYSRRWMEIDLVPDVAKAYFRHWKKRSDAAYRKIDKDDHTESRHCYLIDDYSPYEYKAEKTYAEKVKSAKLAEALDKALTLLTPTQQRRLFSYHVDKKPLRKIAEEECVDHKVVQRSIIAAEKKIRDYFNALKP